MAGIHKIGLTAKGGTAKKIDLFIVNWGVTVWTSTFKRTLLHLHLNFASMFEQAFERTFSVTTDIMI